MVGGFLSEQVKLDYLPSKDLSPKRINRTWIWGLYGAVNKEQALQYYQEIYDIKMRSRIPVCKVKELDIEPEWMDKLLAFEVPPSRFVVTDVLLILLSF